MIEHKFPFQSFIGGWYIDTKLCDDIVNLFDNADSKSKYEGLIYNADSVLGVDKTIKESIDYQFNNPETDYDLYMAYTSELQKVLNKYTERYKKADGVAKYSVNERVNIQYYPPGGGFKKWHSEREGGELPGGKRHLVFMTYLNDVKNGGTEFMYQKLKAPAKKGLTLIWPTDWTHTHRGVISKTQEKYIVTGWFSYERT